VAGEVGHLAAGAGAAARRIVPVGAGQPEDHREEAGGAARGRPARRGPGPGPGPGRPGHRVRGPGPRRERQGRADRPVTTISTSARSPPPCWPPLSRRWEHETGNQQLKTYLRPGKVLRSQSRTCAPEIWGYLLTHYAISA
jgi:hypothetical protein